MGGATDTASNVTSTWDRIFLMAEYEIFGARSYANSSEQNYQSRYDYYANNTADSYRIRGADATNAPVSGATGVNLGAAVHWWERSPCKQIDHDTTYNNCNCLYVSYTHHVTGYILNSTIHNDTTVNFGFIPNFFTLEFYYYI